MNITALFLQLFSIYARNRFDRVLCKRFGSTYIIARSPRVK
jgi:hypothetical protein